MIDRHPGAEAPSAAGRLIDGGAIFAGWVGLGMALVMAISLELIVAVQPLVFLVAPLAGFLIGAYANQRAERWRPVRRVLANAAYAGLITGLGLALLYGSLRLLFVFADSGFRGPGQGGQLECQIGPECTYLRYVAEGQADELAAVGVVDGETFGQYMVSEQITGGLVLVTLTLGGALVAGGIRSVRAEPVNGEPVATGS